MKNVTIYFVIFVVSSFLLYLVIILKTKLITNTAIQLEIINGENTWIFKDVSENWDFSQDSRSTRRKIKHHIPKFMLDLYEKSIRRQHKGHYVFPDVVRSVIPKTAESFDGHILVQDYEDNNHILFFNIPKTNKDEIFISAELKILTIVQTNGLTSEGVERLLEISVYDDLTRSIYSVDKIQIYHQNNTWISFNITTPVRDILENNCSNPVLKVVISIKSFLDYLNMGRNHFKLSLLPEEESFEHEYPVLLLFYSNHKDKSTKNNGTLDEDGLGMRRRRLKRSIDEDYEEETNQIWDDMNKKALGKKLRRMRNTCKKKPLYIDFSEIDYDSWIVQPAGYEAYQCQGKCFYPVANHLSPTKHAIIQALVHSVQPFKATRSCCVPTELGSISLLYIDNGILTYRYAYKDMVVKECGCR